MKHNLLFTSSKINQYISILATAFLISIVSIQQSSAQIVYKDIPDGVPDSIDFNSDGSPEFQIQMNGDYINYFNYGANNNIHALGNANSNWDVPNCVAAGVSIGANSNWIGAGDASVTGWGAGNSSLSTNTDEYIGVRFNFMGTTNMYYGWIRITKNSAGAITYKDYAYNSTPNAAIITGQGLSTGIEDMKIDEVKVFPNPFEEVLHVTGLSSNTHYTLYNQLGEAKCSGNNPHTSMNVSNLASGFYLLKLYDLTGTLLQVKQLVKK